MRRHFLLALALAAQTAVAQAEPVRLATLLPYVAEAFDDFPASVTVVASVRRAEAPPLPAGVLDLGSSHAPSFEQLALARPQVVVADRRLHSSFAGQLARGGAEVILVEANSVAATFEGLLRVAGRLGLERELRARVAEVEAQLDRLARRQPLPVLPVFGAPGSFLLVTERTWLGDLLARQGLVTVLPGASGVEPTAGYVELSAEVLGTLEPRRVLVLCHGDPAQIEEAFRRRFGRALPGSPPVSVLPLSLFAGNPGLRLAEAAEWLARLFVEPGAHLESGP